MGPANSVVVNQTSYPLCLVTFNNTDILYPSYHSFFVVPPGQRLQVDANPDAFGLKIGFIHSTYSDGGKAEFLCYHRLQAKNESVITVTGLGLDGVKYFIDSPNKEDVVFQASSKVKEDNKEVVDTVKECVAEREQAQNPGAGRHTDVTDLAHMRQPPRGPGPVSGADAAVNYVPNGGIDSKGATGAADGAVFNPFKKKSVPINNSNIASQQQQQQQEQQQQQQAVTAQSMSNSIAPPIKTSTDPLPKATKEAKRSPSPGRGPNSSPSAGSAGSAASVNSSSGLGGVQNPFKKYGAPLAQLTTSNISNNESNNNSSTVITNSTHDFADDRSDDGSFKLGSHSHWSAGNNSGSNESISKVTTSTTASIPQSTTNSFTPPQNQSQNAISQDNSGGRPANPFKGGSIIKQMMSANADPIPANTTTGNSSNSSTTSNYNNDITNNKNKDNKSNNNSSNSNSNDSNRNSDRNNKPEVSNKGNTNSTTAIEENTRQVNNSTEKSNNNKGAAIENTATNSSGYDNKVENDSKQVQKKKGEGDQNSSSNNVNNNNIKKKGSNSAETATNLNSNLISKTKEEWELELARAREEAREQVRLEFEERIEADRELYLAAILAAARGASRKDIYKSVRSRMKATKEVHKEEEDISL